MRSGCLSVILLLAAALAGLVIGCEAGRRAASTEADSPVSPPTTSSDHHPPPRNPEP